MPPLIITGLLLVLVGTMPLWPYSRGWGWAPAGMVAVLLAIGTLVAAAGGQL